MIVTSPELLRRVRQIAEENIARNEWPRDGRSLRERITDQEDRSDSDAGSTGGDE